MSPIPPPPSYFHPSLGLFGLLTAFCLILDTLRTLWDSFLTKEMNKDAVDVFMCVWKGCYFCVRVNLFFFPTQREQRFVLSLSVKDWRNRRLWSRSVYIIASGMTAVTHMYMHRHTMSLFLHAPPSLHSSLTYLLHTNSHPPTSFHTCDTLACLRCQQRLDLHTHTHSHNRRHWALTSPCLVSS